MMDDDKVDLVFDDVTQFKKGHKKRLMLCGVLWLITVGILAGLVALIIIRYQKDIELCTTPHCVITAGELLSNIDPTVDPCDNFYEFACGGWLQKHPIPEDQSSYGTFSKLGDDVDMALRGLLERKKSSGDSQSITKAKDLYNACMDLETIEAKDEKPLVQILNKYGGWPVLGDKDGGSWNEAEFDFETMLANFQKDLGVSVVINVFVDIDSKNSSKHVLSVDESGPNMARDYFLEDQYANYTKAYFDYMIALTTLLGADETTAKNDMTAVLEFETKLANLTTPSEERRNNSKLYNPTNITDMEQDISQINWTKFFDILMPEETKPISRKETIINQSPYGTAQLVMLMRDTPPRIVANYMMWCISVKTISSLSKRFRNARHEFHKVLYGNDVASPRWQHCVGVTNGYLQMATGRMYIEEKFSGDSMKNIHELVINVKNAFKGMLDYNDWMDDETKIAAREKCDAITEQIGYPEWINDDAELNKYYEKIDVNKAEYLQTKVKFWNYSSRESLLRLREPVEKHKWDSGPAIVNAWYSPPENQITFPAAILQPPFYHPDSPWYLNYGAIGAVIGHELTHGFDDQGRQYNKDGDSVTWWSEASIANFEKREQCIIDQYSQYVLPENNKTINGVQTQGENIADNGGLKEAFKAYNDNDHSSVRLPGFEDYSPKQLFFLSFAQVWCIKSRPSALDSQIETDPHSPGRYRVIGTLHNSFDFAEAYKCPANSMMNPPAKDKCVIW